MKKLNNKGFTLVEVLATLVILVVIMSIAIPNISSSLERSKKKQNDARIDVLKSYAELYVADHKNDAYISANLRNGYCFIMVDELKKSGYVSVEEAKDSDGNDFDGAIVFNVLNNSYYYTAQLNDNGEGYYIINEDGEGINVSIACVPR